MKMLKMVLFHPNLNRKDSCSERFSPPPFAAVTDW